MVTVPGVMPVTTPLVEIFASALLDDHTPPVTASDKLILNAAITADAPFIVPADSPFTVTTVVALSVPQLLPIV